MFRVGKLRRCVVPLARTTPHSLLQHAAQQRGIQSRHYLKQGLTNRASGTPSATAQVTGLGAGAGKVRQSGSDHDLPETNSRWPRRVFSGIQPTGSLHLGNYLGAVRKWVQLQNAREDVTVCIVDMHSITMPHNPPALRENILNMAATLLSCGVDPSKSSLFVQSSVAEHAEFNWILSSLTTMPRLAQLPQFREKSRLVKDVPLGLYVYPVLQAADIMLYKATHVPVGADQLQHIQLAQHLARTYNNRYGESFPVCHAMVEESNASRVLSLRDPTKKMSKSEGNPKATINLCDPPEVIMQKIKKAVTDFTSDITFEPVKRAGVSNLVNIHSQVTGQTIKSVVDEASTLDTAKYKERVADAVIEHLRPIQEQIKHHLNKRTELVYLLEVGAEKARKQAQDTISDVKQRLGLGTSLNIPAAVHVAPPLPSEVPKSSASIRLAQEQDLNVHQRHDRMFGFGETSSGGAEQSPTGELPDIGLPSGRPIIRRLPVVPTQSLRVEKQLSSGRPRHVFQMDAGNAPHIGFKSPPTIAPKMITGGLPKPRRSGAKPVNLGFKHNSQNVNPSAVSTVAREVSASTKPHDFSANLSNAGYYRTALNASAMRASDRSSAKEKNSFEDRMTAEERSSSKDWSSSERRSSAMERESEAIDEEEDPKEDQQDESGEGEEEKEQREREIDAVEHSPAEVTKIEI
ncbi:hypothetical protein KR018_006067 [Drosophila ironensis]|nr:hypothetical protein KR018_006067 [Drosophila ironensis]